MENRHKCNLCEESFEISKLLFQHQVFTRINFRKLSVLLIFIKFQETFHAKQKISQLIKALLESETLYSSDSDCEYQISIEVIKTAKTRSQHNKLVSSNNEESVKEKVFSNDNKSSNQSEKSDVQCEHELKCLHCPQQFTTNKNLKQHIKMYHVKESGIIELDFNNMSKFICPDCNKELKDMRCLKKHLKLCHNLIISGLIYNSSHKSRVQAMPTVVKNDLSASFPIIRDRSPSSGKPRTKCGICGHGPVYGYTTIIKHQVDTLLIIDSHACFNSMTTD